MFDQSSSLHQSTETQNVMDFFRKYLLLYPEAGRFTDITFVSPQDRIKAMLAAASDGVDRSDALKNAAIESGFKEHMVTYCGRVQKGEITLPEALTKTAFVSSQRGARQ